MWKEVDADFEKTLANIRKSRQTVEYFKICKVFKVLNLRMDFGVVVVVDFRGLFVEFVEV